MGTVGGLSPGITELVSEPLGLGSYTLHNTVVLEQGSDCSIDIPQSLIRCLGRTVVSIFRYLRRTVVSVLRCLCRTVVSVLDGVLSMVGLLLHASFVAANFVAGIVFDLARGLNKLVTDVVQGVLYFGADVDLRVGPLNEGNRRDDGEPDEGSSGDGDG